VVYRGMSVTHLPVHVTSLFAVSSHSPHTGHNALRDEPCEELPQNHSREEGHCEG